MAVVIAFLGGVYTPRGLLLPLGGRLGTMECDDQAFACLEVPVPLCGAGATQTETVLG